MAAITAAVMRLMAGTPQAELQGSKGQAKAEGQCPVVVRAESLARQGSKSQNQADRLAKQPEAEQSAGEKKRKEQPEAKLGDE